LNIDLGVSARFFSFSDDLNNGYYDPSFYRQYLFNVFTYYKIDDDDGISFIFSPGVQRDETLKDYKSSTNYAVEGTFGLYKDWMLKVHVGVVNNIGLSNGPYQRTEVGARLTRRF